MNKEYVLIYTLIGAYMATLASGGYLLHSEHQRAEWYRAQYLDAESIIEAQGNSLEGAQISLTMATGVIETCTKHLKEASQ